MTQPVRIALLGCGVVGSAVATLLAQHRVDLEARCGGPLELVGVAVRRLDRRRDVDLPRSIFTADAEALVTREDVDVVIEVIGGIEPARSLLLAALESGASVVTANKALLAEDGATIFEAAAKAERDIYFEAAVGGAIPIIRPMRESLAGDVVHRVLGIVNGTSNYILDQMDMGSRFDAALEQAQSLGYAEADPTADIDGFDAAAKAAILAGLAFHTRITTADVHREGIADISALDVASAAAMGFVIKPLAICVRSDGDQRSTVSVRVHPAMLPRSHPLAGVRGAFNAVFVESDAAGELMFYGPGAGGAPTASAVMGDLVTVVRNRRIGVTGAGESAYARCEIAPVGETVTRYHVAMEVADQPGVLAEVAKLFAARNVSIQTVRQEGHGDEARLVVVTHLATDAALAETVADLRTVHSVRDVTSVLRVEGVPQ
ncbi:MAG: homoserine dehydrogenase [Nocardioidaceae bacterium]